MLDAGNEEVAVLGSILLTSDGRVGVRRVLGEGLRSDHFASQRNRAIFQAMVALTDRDEPVDVLTVVAELQRAGKVNNHQTASRYLHSLPNLVPSAANMRSYARRVIEVAAVNRKRTYFLAGAKAAEREDYTGIQEAEKALGLIELPGARSNGRPKLTAVGGSA